MDDGAQVLPPPTLEPISRAGSTTPMSNAMTQLPGISSLAAANAAAAAVATPQLRATAGPSPNMYAGASPAATSGGSGGNLPTCQNCSTSTTPLWRRDEFGSVLCNACGLFLKLHGRPRPISLKTDVIKSRNRVKTMRPDLAPKKKQQQQQQAFDPNGVEIAGQVVGAAQAARRASHKPANGQNDDSNSPISRNGTPSMYNHNLPAFMVDDPYQSSGVGGFTSGTAEGRAGSPLNGDRGVDAPQTHEQLIAHNSSLKTRVSELELINELFRSKLSQLEQQEAAARRGQEVSSAEQSQLRAQLEASRESEAHFRAQLEDSHRRENSLKRRLDDLELELKDAKDAVEVSSERPAKKPRIAEPEPEVKTDTVAVVADVSEAPVQPSAPEVTISEAEIRAAEALTSAEIAAASTAETPAATETTPPKEEIAESVVVAASS